jgi:hypothetical protein
MWLELLAGAVGFGIGIVFGTWLKRATAYHAILDHNLAQGVNPQAAEATARKIAKFGEEG